MNIPEDVRCLCEKPKCRKYLMHAKKEKTPLKSAIKMPLKPIKLEKEPSVYSESSSEVIQIEIGNFIG